MNHPHEWLFNAHEKYEKTVFGFKCRHRDAVLEGPEVFKRLDATERLSAEDAKSAAELIASEFDYQWKWDGPDKYRDNPFSKVPRISLHQSGSSE